MANAKLLDWAATSEEQLTFLVEGPRDAPSHGQGCNSHAEVGETAAVAQVGISLFESSMTKGSLPAGYESRFDKITFWAQHCTDPREILTAQLFPSHIDAKLKQLVGNPALDNTNKNQ